MTTAPAHDPFPRADLDHLEFIVGSSALRRGGELVRVHAVPSTLWNSGDLSLTGMVRDGREWCSVLVHFSGDAPGCLLVDSFCSCLSGRACAHVAALVLTASGVRDAPRAALDWERALAPVPLRRPGTVPLGISFTVGRGSLTARLVKPGRSGWIAGNLTWLGLAMARTELHEHPPAQLKAVRELYALHQAGADGYHGRFGYFRPEKDLDVSAFESRQLWPMLAAAVAQGVELVGCRWPAGTAEFGLDVSRTAGGLTVAASVIVDGTPVDPATVVFVGDEAHGVAYPLGAEVCFAAFAEPVPSHLKRLATSAQTLRIPSDAESRFVVEYLGALSRRATIVSSDGSFDVPEFGGPRLAARARYGDDHELTVDWEWSYRIGERELRAPIGGDVARFRDVDAEAQALAELELPDSVFAERAYGGIATMEFTTEALPVLDRRGVLIEIDGTPADYREVGDSVQIGLTTDQAEATDWFDLSVTITADGQPVPFAVLFTALSRGDTHLLLPNGAYFSLDKPDLHALRELIEEARAVDERTDGPIRLSRFQAGLWDEFAQLGVIEAQAREWDEQVRALLTLTSVESVNPPAGLRAELRNYQLDGFRWLAFLWQHRLGGILADDMGLGKTLQTLALIAHAQEYQPATPPPFLIVAPTSVVPNWAAECARFTPHLRVVVVNGSVSAASEVVAGADIVLTSYARFRIDFDGYAQQEWAALVLDEAQFVKNHQAKTHQCARKLAAPFKLAITGTPMENNIMELWSLLSITAPGLFPSAARFTEYYRRPIEKKGDAELLARLRRRVRPLLLRRTKELVAADLPAKVEQVLELDLHPAHRKLYETRLQRERAKILGLLDDMDRNRFTIFRSLTLLRQLSLHAALVADGSTTIPSVKIDTLADQLRGVLDGGHKALVFSQFTGFLGLVRARLDQLGIPYTYLDGHTRDRKHVVDDFRNGSAGVFLISLKAGGFGLNLTDADYVFLLDPWWNPAVEAQAVDRAHRIGQRRTVMVYRLIAKDTIEEKVMALKARKAQLVSSILDSDSMLAAALTAEDIRGLFE